MATPPVSLYTRIPGRESFTIPVLQAAGIQLGSPVAAQSHMPYPAGQGQLTWQGTAFGLTAPDSGGLHANVWQVLVSVRHFCSSPADFASVTGQIYDTQSSTVVASAPFTLSGTYVTETVTLTSGYPYADVPHLAARLAWDAVSPGYATVSDAYAEISYSYSDSIGQLTVPGTAALPGVVPSVSLPAMGLVSAGTVAFSLTPSFGQPTTAGDLLVAWVYSNSNSSSFGTACSDPSWTLAGHAGAAYGWESLWCKPRCGAAETPPVFSDSGYSEPLSELLEFSGAGDPDQVAGGIGAPDVTYTAPARDSASGDLIFGFCAWNGSNTGPAAITVTGKDSSGAVLTLAQQDNHAATGTQFWATAWGQAGAPVGPATDVMTSSIGIYAGGAGLMASFLPLGGSITIPAAVASPRFSRGQVPVTVPYRAGRR